MRPNHTMFAKNSAGFAQLIEWQCAMRVDNIDRQFRRTHIAYHLLVVLDGDHRQSTERRKFDAKVDTLMGGHGPPGSVSWPPFVFINLSDFGSTLFCPLARAGFRKPGPAAPLFE